MSSNVWQMEPVESTRSEGAKIWTRNEEDNLVKAVQGLRGHAHIRNDSLWLTIVNRKEFPNRKMIDLKDQFLSKILPNIRSYVDSKEAGKFNRAGKFGSSFGLKRSYSAEEKGKIIKGIIRYSGRVSMTGVTMWKEIAQKIPGRSWQSVKEHFKMQIYPSLHKIGLKPDIKQTLEERLKERENYKKLTQKSSPEVNISSEEDSSQDEMEIDITSDVEKDEFLHGDTKVNPTVYEENLNLMKTYGKPEGPAKTTSHGTSQMATMQTQNTSRMSNQKKISQSESTSNFGAKTSTIEEAVDTDDSSQTSGDDNKKNKKSSNGKEKSNGKTRKTDLGAQSRDIEDNVRKNQYHGKVQLCPTSRNKETVNADESTKIAPGNILNGTPSINENSAATAVESSETDTNQTQVGSGLKGTTTAGGKPHEGTPKLVASQAKNEQSPTPQGSQLLTDKVVAMTPLDKKIVAAQKCVAYVLEQSYNQDVRIRDAAEAALFSLVESKKHIMLLEKCGTSLQ